MFAVALRDSQTNVAYKKETRQHRLWMQFWISKDHLVDTCTFLLRLLCHTVDLQKWPFPPQLPFPDRCSTWKQESVMLRMLQETPNKPLSSRKRLSSQGVWRQRSSCCPVRPQVHPPCPDPAPRSEGSIWRRAAWLCPASATHKNHQPGWRSVVLSPWGPSERQ